MYGLPLDLGALYEFARVKAPECLYESRRTTTSINVIEKYQCILGCMLCTEVGYDVFDEDLKPIIVLVLHEESFKYSKLKLEDEEFLRKELGIKEKGKWYRYIGAFASEELENYKKRAVELGSIPSRNDPSDGVSKVCTTCEGSGRVIV